MKYSELNDLWGQQQGRVFEWRRKLKEQCVLLRNAFVAEIDAPSSKWKDPVTEEEQPYIGLIYLDTERTRLKGYIPDEALTDDGELKFGLLVTFDFDADSPQRETIFLPMAVRFLAGKPQFSFFNTEIEQPETPPGWIEDVPKTVELMVERIAEYVKLDPFNGPPSRAGIGFL